MPRRMGSQRDRTAHGEKRQQPGTVLLVDFDAGEHGHRGQYNAMLGRLFALRRAGFSLATLLARDPVLCPQIEAAPLRFALTGLLRGLAGRRTVGFLMRPLPALRGTSPRLRAKRLALRLLRRMPAVHVLTIVPFALEPGLGAIARGWIHDLQNWDMQLDPDPVGAAGRGEQHRAIRAQASGRMVCCAIGRQERAKGFDRFAELWCAEPALRERMLFAFGGSVAAGLKPLACDFADAGGFALDRFVSDAELLELYLAADLIWCAYAPDYDQASGILGRAMQLGVPVVTREGSVIAAICAAEGHPHIALGSEADASAILVPVRPLDREQARRRAEEQGRSSLERLASALGAAPAWDPFENAPSASQPCEAGQVEA